MNIHEARQKLAKHGIFQLRKGESIADALRSVDNGTPRIGYKYKTDNGRLMSENEQIAESNKEAFSKMVTPKEFTPEEVDDIDDIAPSHDFREDEERGVIALCYYCGDAIRVSSDGLEEDYEINEPEVHCNDCMNNAIWNLAM